MNNFCKWSLVYFLIFSFHCFPEHIEGSGNIIKYKQIFSSITALTIYGIGKIHIIECNNDKKPSLKIITDNNIMNHLFITIENNHLCVEQKNKIVPTKLTYYISLKKKLGEFLLKIHNNSSTVIGFLTASIFRLIASDQSKIKGLIFSNYLNILASGSSNIRLDGSIKEQNLNFSDSAQYLSTSLQCKKCEINSSGTSQLSIHCSSIEGRAAGNSIICCVNDGVDIDINNVQLFDNAAISLASNY